MPTARSPYGTSDTTGQPLRSGLPPHTVSGANETRSRLRLEAAPDGTINLLAHHVFLSAVLADILLPRLRIVGPLTLTARVSRVDMLVALAYVVLWLGETWATTSWGAPPR